MTSPCCSARESAVVAGPTAAGETAGEGCDGALPKDRLNFVERQQGPRDALAQCRKKPSARQINEHEYCNKEYYGRLTGSVLVSLGQKEASFELDLQLHMVSPDGSCALYCLLQAVRDAERSNTFWRRLLGLRTDRPRLVEGMEKLAQIAVADTVGCPILRKTLCEYMLNRAELPGLWNKPPADCEIAAGVRVAEQEGIRWDQSTPGVWQQHAVAFLAPKRYYDEHYQKVLHAFLDDGLAIVTIEHRLDRLSENPAKKLRSSRSGPSDQSGRGYFHYRNLVEEGTSRAVILWPMCLEQPEYAESSNLSHYHHVRAFGADELTSLAFIECTQNAAATAAIRPHRFGAHSRGCCRYG